jgi:hypothetical protein
MATGRGATPTSVLLRCRLPDPALWRNKIRDAYAIIERRSDRQCCYRLLRKITIAARIAHFQAYNPADLGELQIIILDRLQLGVTPMAWQTSDRIAAISAACAIFVFGLGFWQYRSSEKWKRSEFVAAQIKEFNSDRINRSVLRMMDYDPARVELFPGKPNFEDRYVEVPFDTLVKSINQSISKDQDFDEIEFEVLQYFEHFLTSLSRLDYFVRSGSIQVNELCADLDHVASLMNGDAREMKLKNTGLDIAPFAIAVRNYIKNWDHEDVAHLIQEIRVACK